MVNQPKSKHIPRATIQRLATYVQVLENLSRDGVEVISSNPLAEACGVNGSQVRKDLAYFGEFGIRGVGYHVTSLIASITSALGVDREWRMALVGVGNLGKAIRLAESEDFRRMYEELIRILKGIRTMDISELLENIRRLKDQDMDLHECLDFMQIWYRDALMFKVTKDANLLVFKEEFGAINELSTAVGYEGFEHILQAIDKARIRLDANVNMELAMELMLLVMKENG